MKHTRLNQCGGTRRGTAALALLFLLALTAGCTHKDATNRTDEVHQFLAPTNVSKMRPEARAHLPGGGQFQPTSAQPPK